VPGLARDGDVLAEGDSFELGRNVERGEAGPFRAVTSREQFLHKTAEINRSQEMEVRMNSVQKIASGTILLLAASGAGAQDLVAVAPGQRVRLTLDDSNSEGSSLVGEAVALDDSRMTLRVSHRKELVVVPRPRIKQLELNTGRRSRGRKALIGAAVGTAIGVVVGLDSYGGGDETFSKSGSAMIGGVMLGTLGALVGVALPPGERWKTVPMTRVHLALTPARGRGAAISLAFAW
jgi:hypothetical protein